MLPDTQRCENRRTDWRMTLVGTARETLTGVMLP